MIPIVPYPRLDAARELLRAYGVIVMTGMFTKPEALALRERVLRECPRKSWVVRETFGLLPRLVLLRRGLFQPVLCIVFRRLGELRNRLAGQPDGWALAGPEDGWWTDYRFNCYPRGGGHMREHCDAEYVGAEPPGGMVQPLLLLSQPGEHYYQGGGYARLHGKTYTTDRCIGDVIVYTGAVPHGVKPVDPHSDKGGTQWKINGRLVAAVTPLRVLDKRAPNG